MHSLCHVFTIESSLLFGSPLNNIINCRIIFSISLTSGRNDFLSAFSVVIKTIGGRAFYYVCKTLFVHPTSQISFPIFGNKNKNDVASSESNGLNDWINWIWSPKMKTSENAHLCVYVSSGEWVVLGHLFIVRENKFVASAKICFLSVRIYYSALSFFRRWTTAITLVRSYQNKKTQKNFSYGSRFGFFAFGPGWRLDEWVNESCSRLKWIEKSHWRMRAFTANSHRDESHVHSSKTLEPLFCVCHHSLRRLFLSLSLVSLINISISHHFDVSVPHYVLFLYFHFLVASFQRRSIVRWLSMEFKLNGWEK